MNNQPAQPITNTTARTLRHSSPDYDAIETPDTATATINADQLRTIAGLLDIIDGFLRSDTIPEQLTAYLRATGADQPRPPHGASHTTGLLIDQISFNAHHLRNHHRNRYSDRATR